MTADSVAAVVEDTPRPAKRAFTDTTENWFAAGDELCETPQKDVYQEQPDRSRPILIHAVVIAFGWTAGLFAAWLVL